MCSLQEYKGIEMVGIPSASEIITNQELEQYMLENAENKDDDEVGEGGNKYYSSSPKRKLEESSVKHAMAERKRRRRINHHYETLRSLLPHLPKRDKPTVLKETVRRVKELKKMAAQYMAEQQAGQGCSNSGIDSSCSLFLPNDKDELIISPYEDHHNTMVKVVICCEDRQGFNKSLSEAMLAAKAGIVKADMVAIGGRIKAELVVKWLREGGGGEEDVGMLRRALKAVVGNRAFAGSLLFGPRLGDSSLGNLGHDLGLGQCKQPGEYSDCFFDTLLL
ncbi:hypothetical protein LIER_27777 [Lithospermum erythrorhizon]|uniref:BHLH domain-containing protein n=1 Tax=Lithospermum erythrorhizon TaxID=34254 RepID=A0AAV3RG88_LITER